MPKQDSTNSKIENKELNNKEKTEYTYQDVLMKAEAKESAKESLLKLAQLKKEKYEGKEGRINEIKETFEKALIIANREHHADLISYLKLILSIMNINEKKDANNTNIVDSKNEWISLDKRSIYSHLMSAAIELDNIFLLRLLIERVNLSRFQLDMICTDGHLDMAEFVLSKININHYDDWESIVYDNLNLKGYWQASGFSGLKIALKNLEVAEILIRNPKFDINCNFFDTLVDPEDSDKVFKELLDIKDYTKYANTLLTYIIVQKTWLATTLLKEQFGTDIHKSPNFIYMLQTVLNAKLAPVIADNSFNNFCIILIRKLTKIFNELVQREDMLINARSYYAGATPLHMAVYCYDHPAVHSLILAGADITLLDNQLVRVNSKYYIMNNLDSRSSFIDIYLRFGDKIDAQTARFSPLDCAAKLQDDWLAHYLSALDGFDRIRWYCSDSQKDWASKIRKQAIQIAKDLDAPTRVSRSAREGNIFAELPIELNRYVLSFLPSRKIIPQNSILKMLENVPGMYQQLKTMLQPSKLIREKININGVETPIDHRKPSLERQHYINYVKEQTDLKIYGKQAEELEESPSVPQMSH